MLGYIILGISICIIIGVIVLIFVNKQKNDGTVYPPVVRPDPPEELKTK